MFLGDTWLLECVTPIIKWRRAINTSYGLASMGLIFVRSDSTESIATSPYQDFVMQLQLPKSRDTSSINSTPYQLHRRLVPRFRFWR